MRTLRWLTARTSTGRAILHADELLASGRAGEAIAALTEANRAERDPRIERRLVELRTSAARDALAADVPPPWPEHVEDLVPGAGVPEVDHDRLTPELLRSAIVHHGSLLVRGLVGPERVEQLRHDIDRSFEAFDAAAEGRRVPELSGWYVPYAADRVSDRARRRRRGALATVESPPTLFDLLEAFREAGVDRLAAEHFAEQPMLLARKGTLRRLPHNTTGGWHQDGAFMGEGIRSLNIWLALSHCGDDAPGLDVVARRLDSLVKTGVTGVRERGSGYSKWGVSSDVAEEVAADAIERPIFEPGDALLFDHLCLHRTGTDPGMSKPRYAIETWFLAPSTYAAMTAQRDDGYSPRDQLPIAV